MTEMNAENIPNGELIVYHTADGKTELQLRAEDGSIWLTQLEMAELFASTKQNISLHINNILKEGELPEHSVVKESLTTAADGKKYRTNLFFAEVQNKLLYAVTHHTAAELVLDRADPNSPNMALMSWSGSRVRKQDVVVAKNYLSNDEIDTLNRLVVIFLEQAELRVKERKQLTLNYWRSNVDRMLEFNEKVVLQNKGSVSHEEMTLIAHNRYEQFDAARRLAEAQQANADDLTELEQIEKQLVQKEGGK